MDEFGMDAAIETFLTALKKSDIYEEYAIQRDKIRQIPELKEKIDEFRKKNFELQSSTGSEELFDKQEILDQTYAEILADPIAADFLAAELAFCRMMQEINREIIEAVDFD